MFAQDSLSSKALKKKDTKRRQTEYLDIKQKEFPLQPPRRK